MFLSEMGLICTVFVLNTWDSRSAVRRILSLPKCLLLLIDHTFSLRLVQSEVVSKCYFEILDDRRSLGIQNLTSTFQQVPRWSSGVPFSNGSALIDSWLTSNLTVRAIVLAFFVFFLWTEQLRRSSGLLLWCGLLVYYQKLPLKFLVKECFSTHA